MKWLFVFLALALLPACSQQNVKDVLTNLDKDCVRHYTGTLTAGMGTSGSVAFTIDCQPSGVVAPPPASGSGAPAQPIPLPAPPAASPAGQLPPPATKPSQP